MILSYTEAIQYPNPMLVTESQPYGTKFKKSLSNVSGNYLSTILGMCNFIKFNQAASQVQPGWRPFYWDLYCICSSDDQYLDSEVFDSISFVKTQTHTTKCKKPNDELFLFIFFFKKGHLTGTTFPSEVTPCRCACFGRPNLSWMDIQTKQQTMNRYSLAWQQWIGIAASESTHLAT